MTTTYIVNFYNPLTGDLVEMLDNRNIVQLTYERLVNDVGTFSVTCPGDSHLAERLNQVDMVAEVIRVNPTTRQREVEETYFCRYFECFQDEQNQEYIIVGGVQLLHLVKRRLILPEDDLTGAGGWSTKAAPAADVIYEFVRDQCVSPVLNTSRSFSGLSATTVSGTGGYVFERVQYENLFEVIQRCAVNGSIDFRIVRTTGMNFEFQCAALGNNLTSESNYGQNKSVVFSLERDNIVTPRMSFDYTNEENVCYVFGQGPENDREIVKTIGFDTGLSPWNSIESRTDSRNSEAGDYAGLVNSGNEYLQAHGLKKTFSFQLTEMERSAYYNVRWTLYDYVTAMYRGYSLDLRILGISVTLDEEGDKLDIVLSDPLSFADPTTVVALRRNRQHELEQSIDMLRATQKKVEQNLQRQIAYDSRSEVSGARPRITFTTQDAFIGDYYPKRGQMWWIINGRKPGEGVGAGTGIPAEWDGSNLISGYSGTAVTV